MPCCDSFAQPLCRSFGWTGGMLPERPGNLSCLEVYGCRVYKVSSLGWRLNSVVHAEVFSLLGCKQNRLNYSHKATVTGGFSRGGCRCGAVHCLSSDPVVCIGSGFRRLTFRVQIRWRQSGDHLVESQLHRFQYGGRWDTCWPVLVGKHVGRPNLRASGSSRRPRRSQRKGRCG